MKRFLLKFCILFTLIWGLIGYFAFIVRPHISGDMGTLGKIPFGHEYNRRIETKHASHGTPIQTIGVEDSITSSVITIGDSFSQLGACGYNQFLADAIGGDVINIQQHPYEPEQTFVRLVNNHKIPSGAIVIVETVERALWGRLINLDLQDSVLIRREKSDKGESISLLDETLIWLKEILGIKQPIVKFHTRLDLFSHQTRHNELYIYNSKWVGDGDLLFLEDVANKGLVEQACCNLYNLHEFAENHGIQLLYLIAADKYDVYSPFIISDHPYNPTLDMLPDETWIINPKPFLQKKVFEEVKDVYYINDTHWSPIGAKIVADEIANRLIEEILK